MSGRQPLMHELSVCVRAPTVTLSALDGQIGPPDDVENGHGVLHADVRVLSGASVTVDGVAAESLAGGATGTGTAAFVGLLRHLGDGVRLERRREVTATGMRERFALVNHGAATVTATVRLHLAADGVPISTIRAGRRGPCWAWRSTEWRSGGVRTAGSTYGRPPKAGRGCRRRECWRGRSPYQPGRAAR
ncbi:glycogen debranching N-terminal domain-containing protein [Fodinicola feengrottensis]|uniref:glycogen debranching N-terminal domain-containing protein n=1 Tax=Fodinicola feengrottensis TaxID=435914 RepID=UPI002442E2D1|nr:glycogen debranching N-terminal domain-containing protein [Fodinicola feengrottensis]